LGRRRVRTAERAVAATGGSQKTNGPSARSLRREVAENERYKRAVAATGRSQKTAFSGPKGRRTLAGGFSPRKKPERERAAKSAPETARRGARAALKMVFGDRIRGGVDLGGRSEAPKEMSRFPAPAARRIPIRP